MLGHLPRIPAAIPRHLVNLRIRKLAERFAEVIQHRANPLFQRGLLCWHIARAQRYEAAHRVVSVLFQAISVRIDVWMLHKLMESGCYRRQIFAPLAHG